MTTDTYNKAKSVMDGINQCNNDLGIIFGLVKQVVPIRFGGHYNVSSPINVTEETLKKIMELIRVEKQNLLGELSDEFQNI